MPSSGCARNVLQHLADLAVHLPPCPTVLRDARHIGGCGAPPCGLHLGFGRQLQQPHI